MQNQISGELIKESQEEIRIGTILHLTGDQAEPAEAFLKGIELAVEEINNKGGITGKQIKLFIEDDELKPRLAHTAAVKLVNADKIHAIILASYLEAMVAGPYLEEQKTPSIVLWDTAKDIEDIGEYIFGIGIWTPSAGEGVANYAYNELGIRKISIINIQNEWSLAVADFFEQEFNKLGGEIINRHTILSSDTTDFRTTITKIQKENPDAIYSPITDGITVFYKQLKEFGFDKPVISSDIITENHIEILGNAAEGIYQTQANDPEGERTQHMIELYFKKHSKLPKQLLFTSWGYDSVYLFKEAIEKSHSLESEKIKDGLYKIREFKGASGTISFDEKGSSRKLEKMFQIQRGEFILVEK